MLKPLLSCFIAFFLSLLIAGSVFGQQLLVSETKHAELQALSAQLRTVYNAGKQSAQALAKQHGWSMFRTTKNGTVISLQGVNSLGFPIYLKTDNNTTAAATTGTNTVQPGGILGLNLSGSSTFLNGKIAIWDGGSVLTTHQEFAGKTITLKSPTYPNIEHATHVAGTMIAKGVYAPAKGMSFGAQTLLSYEFDNDVADMTAASSGLLVSNHSYGEVSGWNFNSDQNRWEWYGLPGDTEDYTFGYYDSRAQSFDKIAYNAPYYLIVQAAGNARGETGPAVGADYWGYRSRTDQTIVDKGARPAGISNNDGYDVIPSSALAKNILTVGAVNPLPFGPVSRTDVTSAYFSSWGPTDDGRIKPDISGDGVNVLSSSNAGPTAYVTLSGTSMATPNISGSLYLLQEYYAQKNSGAFMRSATLKGLVCHTAFDAGNVGPDYIYGWGLLNMQKAAQAITDNGTKSLIKENSLSQGQTQTFNVVASGDGVLSATICWTDPQATPSAAGTLNSRTPKLINDLDLRVSDGTSTFTPWVLDPANPSANATNGDNIRDNIEQVYVGNSVPGKTYTITVTHKGTLQSGAQAYSLIETGVGGTAYCASAPTSSADSRINNFTLSNINNMPAPGCTTYSNYTNLTGQLEQGKTYQLSLTLGTCGSNFNKIAKVYIDYNGDGSFTGSGELVATTGVINGTGIFTTNITVPGNVIVGNYSLMRVVLTETSDPNAVTPCGSYAKGETQDYQVQFLQTSIDVGAISVTNSSPTGSCAGKTNLSVRLKNFGTATVSNIPVTVVVTAPDNTVTTINETYTGTLTANSEADFVLQGTFNAVAGATYAITATTNLTGDVVTSNNQSTTNIAFASAPSASNLSAYYCTDAKQYLLSGTADGSLFWYKNAADALPFTSGSPVYTSQAPVNNTYYAGVNDFAGNVGPVSKNLFTGGGYNQFTPFITVKTTAPVVIESARLYVGNSGQITFNVNNANGQTVSTTTINAVATRSTPGAGALADDPNDQGQVYTLNLSFPAAGTYSIGVGFDNNATIYRSNAGVTGYPFTLAGVFSITGNNATSATDTAFYKKNYYYLYDMHVKSIGCPSATRQAVTLSKPVITQTDTLLRSSYVTGNQWYFNGKPVIGATGQTFPASQSGNYQVSAVVASGCTVLSDIYPFALTALHPDGSTDIGLTVFPVPASSKLNVLFKAQADGDVNLSLINNAGQVVYTNNQTITAGNFSTAIDVSKRATGTYVLRVKVGGKVYGRKILVLTK